MKLTTALLVVAAVALLPSWLVGGAALGAAVGLWVSERLGRRHLPRQDTEAEEIPTNVIPLRPASKAHGSDNGENRGIRRSR